MKYMKGQNGSYQGDTGTLYIKGIKRHIRDNFHAACAKRGKSMREVILDFMQVYARTADSVKIKRVRK